MRTCWCRPCGGTRVSRSTWNRHSTRLQVAGNDELDSDEDALNDEDTAGTYLPANTIYQKLVIIVDGTRRLGWAGGRR